MKKVLLPARGGNVNYFRANLHCHSTISDGSKTPEQLKADYKAHGYSILSLTDHEVFIPHNDMSDDDFLMLNGYEIGVNSDDGRVCHLCLVSLEKDNDVQVCYHRSEYIGGNPAKHRSEIHFDETKPDFVREYTPECINEIIKTGVENNFFVTYNHPVWSLESYPEYMSFNGMNAMEIMNYASVVAGWDDDNGHCYEDMLRGGKRLFCIGADDNHNRVPDTNPKCGSYGGYIMVAAPSLTYEAVAKALKNGDFYAAYGDYMRNAPEIFSLEYEDGTVRIKTSDARLISYMPDNRANKCVNAPVGEAVNEAEFKVHENTKWFRIVVTDDLGYKAYTNAYFIDELKAED